MVYVIAASILSIVVSLVYVGYVWRSFRQVSLERKQSNHTHEAAAPSNWENESWFSWKALISIVMSSVILIVVGQSPFLWNYVPFIAIGSAIAVIFAFSFDLQKNTN
jgi:hypothetical protein